MKKRTIIISILSTSALVILLLLQLYWINSAIRINAKVFNENANTAVSNAINKIQKIESTRSLIKKIKTFYGDTNIFNTHSPAQNFLFKYYQNLPDSLDNRVNNDKSRGQNSRLGNKTLKTNLIGDALNNVINSIHFELIDNRVDKLMIDSIIKKELTNNGIETDYEYGVYSPIKNTLVIQKTGNYKNELMSKGMKYNLFPGEAFQHPEYLYIYYPEKKQYILTHMWEVFIISGVLTGILFFIFFFTILTLYRQQKFSALTTNLINNISHEFKTPVATISLACEALNDEEMIKMEGGSLGTEAKKMYKRYVNIIKEEDRRLELMVENLLQASILEKGEVRLKREPLRVHILINDVIKNISIQIEKKHGIIKTEFLAEKDLVNADKTHLTNVIYNLLDNANKYTKCIPQIFVKTEDISQGIIISITDNGIGISKNDQKKIFNNLYRVPTGDKHDVKGFGLGLPYVKSIIEKHGGSITVKSEIKKGTTFKLLLPFI